MTRGAVWQAGPWNQTRSRRLWNRAIHRPWCLCGHHRQAHRHYRRGSDCGLCACPSFTGRRRI